MSINQHAHPVWCDPRLCNNIADEQLDHRGTPMSWKVGADDYLVTVGLARFDGIGPFPHTGEVFAHLTLLDMASGNLDGTDRTIHTDLSAADARLLAAALLCAAEQLETMTAVDR